MPLTTVFNLYPNGTIPHFWTSELIFVDGDPGQDPQAQAICARPTTRRAEAGAPRPPDRRFGREMDQAITARRRAAIPTIAKPTIIRAHDAGSGTWPVTVKATPVESWE